MRGRETSRRRLLYANGMAISRSALRNFGVVIARSLSGLLIEGHAATLLTATHDLALSHAEVLRGILLRKKKK